MREIETCIMESGDLLFLVQVNAILSLEYVDLLLLQFLVHLLIGLQVVLNRAVQSDYTSWYIPMNGNALALKCMHALQVSIWASELALFFYTRK